MSGCHATRVRGARPDPIGALPQTPEYLEPKEMGQA